MEILVLCMVAAGFIQRVGADWWAGVSGKTFPSQKRKMARLEARLARQSARDNARGTAPARHPALEYFAGHWAAAWDTAAARHRVRSEERQTRWADKRAAEQAGDTKPHPMRDYVSEMWQTGPPTWWARAWSTRLDKRRRKLAAKGGENPDSEPTTGPDSDQPEPTPQPDPGNEAPEATPDPEPTTEQPVPTDAAPEPMPEPEPTRSDAGETDDPPAPDTAPGSEPATGPDGTSEQEGQPTMNGSPTPTDATPVNGSAPSGEAEGLDAKIAFVGNWSTLLQSAKSSFELFGASLERNHYGPRTQAAARQAMEAMSAAAAAVEQLSEVICQHAVNVRDVNAAADWEVGDPADLRR